MRFLTCLMLALSATFGAELPTCYRTVNRVTWIVENIDKARRAWELLGLSGIREYQNIQLVGDYRGKPVTIYAWQITGELGNLTIDMIQPAEGQSNAYTNFLSKHDDGILAIVHEAPDRQTLDREIRRMKEKGVSVLQQVTMQGKEGPVTYVYFDTEPEGKFVLGLVYGSGLQTRSGRALISHFGSVVWDVKAVSAYWEKLGFPALSMRADEAGIDVGWQRHAQFGYEWISPPASPTSIYAEFLNRHHREGIHHIALQVEDVGKVVESYQKLGFKARRQGNQVYLDADGGVSMELSSKP